MPRVAQPDTYIGTGLVLAKRPCLSRPTLHMPRLAAEYTVGVDCWQFGVAQFFAPLEEARVALVRGKVGALMTYSDDTRIVLDNPIHGNIQSFLERYYAEREREPRFSGAHPLFVQFQALGRAVAGSTPFHIRRSQFDVSWSLGMGNWARVPWIACVDAREKTMTTSSLYVTYLFRQDMTGVYLTLTQGVAAFTEELPRREARMQMRARAEALRNKPFIATLRQSGFSLENTLDLRTEAALGRDYEFGVIAYKLYT
jgi:MrcB-like, N-terminal domain